MLTPTFHESLKTTMPLTTVCPTQFCSLAPADAALPVQRSTGSTPVLRQRYSPHDFIRLPVCQYSGVHRGVGDAPLCCTIAAVLEPQVHKLTALVCKQPPDVVHCQLAEA